MTKSVVPCLIWVFVDATSTKLQRLSQSVRLWQKALTETEAFQLDNELKITWELLQSETYY